MNALKTSAVELSKYIVTKCVQDEHPISNLQLQKILYYIQKYFLKHDSLAFFDEIEAWQFGPVVPNSFYQFCGFGAMPITNEYPNTLDFDNESKQVIDSIITAKRELKPWQLVQEIHKPNGAWATVYNKGLGNHHTIPMHLIREESDCNNVHRL